MNQFLAHTANSLGITQALEDHLLGVAKRSSGFAAKFGASGEGCVTGLLHDLGKFKDEFQDYILGKRQAGNDTHHAPYGAAYAFMRGLCGSFAIAGHHAGLHNRGDLQALVEDEDRYNIGDELPNLMERFQNTLGHTLNEVKPPDFLECPFSYELYIRMLFSCLVDADYLDTEEHFSEHSRQPLKMQSVVEDLLTRIHGERESKSQKGPVNEIRHRLFDQCLQAGERKQGFFSLTVPTGGGKTLSSMAFALKHAKRWDLDRIIVVIPYLSIIEQNAAEYKRVLDPNNEGIVIEHHCAITVSEDNEPSSSTDSQRAVENWDAPIIVTTSVQFLESLLASSPSRCRKLHNICRSVVILDEVQTLPSKLLAPLLNVFRELVDNYGLSFLFMSATQPGFKQDVCNLPYGFTNEEIHEISQDTNRVFNDLKRVQCKDLNTLSWQEVSSRMMSQEQVLTVVNVRKHAFELWEALNSKLPENERDSLFHISSAMCPEHRLWTIGTIKDPRPGSIRDRLARGLPCRVVSTQVVEAGVDLDFPVLFRAMGPLDSIIQAAGRCNREGRLRDKYGRSKPGEVFIFTPEKHTVPPGIYKTSTDQTYVFIQGLDSLDTLWSDPSLFRKYFSNLIQYLDTDHTRNRESSIQEDRSELRFREVSRKAKVIEDQGSPVAIPFGAGKRLVSEIHGRFQSEQSGTLTRKDLRTLQRFMVNLRTNDLEKALRYGLVSAISPGSNLYVALDGCYHDQLGLLIEERPTEDFFL